MIGVDQSMKAKSLHWKAPVARRWKKHWLKRPNGVNQRLEDIQVATLSIIHYVPSSQVMNFYPFFFPGVFDFRSIGSKVGANVNCRERLQQFDLVGCQTSRIFVSSNFKTFVSVDDVGIPYILQEIVVDQMDED